MLQVWPWKDTHTHTPKKKKKKKRKKERKKDPQIKDVALSMGFPSSCTNPVLTLLVELLVSANTGAVIPARGASVAPRELWRECMVSFA